MNLKKTLYVNNYVGNDHPLLYYIPGLTIQMLFQIITDGSQNETCRTNLETNREQGEHTC